MLELSILLAASLAATAPTPAATLTGIDGVVLVSHGEAFVTVTGDQSLASGDRVLVMEGATATLANADGCVVVLQPGTMVEISPVTDCATVLASATRIGPLLAQAESGEDDDAVETEKAATGATSTGLIIGAGVVLAAVAIGGGGGGDDDQPTSP